MVLQILIFIQSTLQLLYTFYECRTHIQIVVREILYKETSLTVEKIKIDSKRELSGFDGLDQKIITPSLIQTSANLRGRSSNNIGLNGP
jgi:hypothetical protein